MQKSYSGNTDELVNISNDLLSAVEQSDYQTFEEIHVKWQLLLQNFIQKLTKSRTEAEDIVQDVFLTLWEKRNEINLGRDLKSLIFSMARNKTVSNYRARQVKESYLKNMVLDEIDQNDSHEILVIKETELMLEHILHDMPKQRREIYEMSVKEEMSAEEIAEKLNIRKETVYQQLSRAKKELEIKMKDMGELLMLLVLLAAG